MITNLNLEFLPLCSTPNIFIHRGRGNMVICQIFMGTIFLLIYLGKSNQDNFLLSFFQLTGFAGSSWDVNPSFGKTFLKNLSF